MPDTPRNIPKGRALQDFLPLLPAEEKLRSAVREGEKCVITDTRPECRTQKNTVRAEFLRFLALGGDAESPVHEKGINFTGAWVTGTLDLSGCTLPRRFGAVSCCFEQQLGFQDAHVCGPLDLSGSLISGLNGNRLLVDGDVFLCGNFICCGHINLIGVTINGSLDCQAGVFLGDNKEDPKNKYSLSIERALIKGSALFSKCNLANKGMNLHSAEIGGHLDLYKGDFSSQNGPSIQAEGLQVNGFFRVKQLRKPLQGIDLTSCRVGRLEDDAGSWGSNLHLNGFVYENVANDIENQAAARLVWLKKQVDADYNNPISFKPQPWKQLIRTLRRMGHDEDARQVAIAYEQHRRKIGLITGWDKQFAHLLFGWLIGYGYRPLRLVYIMLAVWLGCGALYWSAALNGVFAPSNPQVFLHGSPLMLRTLPQDKNAASLVLQQDSYQHCRPDYPFAGQPNQEEKFNNWYLCPQLAGEYTGFSPLAYSLDLLLPLVDLQQEHDWAPYVPTPQENWGDELLAFSKYHWTRLLVWFEILFGWVASLLLVAVLSGLTNRDQSDE